MRTKPRITVAQTLASRTLGDYLHSRCRSQGKTFEQVAATLGYPEGRGAGKTRISRMFGKGRVPLHEIIPLAHALGVNPIDLFHLVLATLIPPEHLERLDLSSPSQLRVEEIAMLDAYRAANPIARAVARAVLQLPENQLLPKGE